MGTLRKHIARIGQSDRPAMGFGRVSREKPRATLLAARVRDGKVADAARTAGVDIVIVEAKTAQAALDAGGGSDDDLRGAILDELTPGDTAKLKEAGFEFVIAPLASTPAAAVDPDGCEFVPMLEGKESEELLRSVGQLRSDAVALAAGTGLSLVQQLELARVSLLTGAPLIVLADSAGADVGDLRVLRDAGAAVIVAPASASSDALQELGDRLREVPPRRSRDEGGSAPLVPMPSAGMHDHDHDEPDEDD